MPICGLCLNPVDELQDSHLMPKAAYKRIRDISSAKNVKLVNMNFSTDSAFYTDEQYKRHFLCEVCEDRFNKNGEKIMGNLWVGKSSFPLLDKIRSSAPLIPFDNGGVHDHSFLSKQEADGILYFAISIFWRASEWPERITSYQKSLGSKYTNEFSEFLEKGGSLSKVKLMVLVNSNTTVPDSNAIFSLPQYIKNSEGCHHIFTILGIRFHMVLGECSVELKQIFSLLGSKVGFFTCDFEKTEINQGLVSDFSRLKVKGKLADLLAPRS